MLYSSSFDALKKSLVGVQKYFQVRISFFCSGFYQEFGSFRDLGKSLIYGSSIEGLKIWPFYCKKFDYFFCDSYINDVARIFIRPLYLDFIHCCRQGPFK